MRNFQMPNRGIPLFFKLWFGFVASMAISVIAFAGYMAFQVVSNPEGSAAQLGKTIGAAVNGYNEATK